jgi:uncharacterized protein
MSFLQSFHALQEIQSELKSVQARLQGLPDWMTELHREHQARSNEIALVEADHGEQENLRREAETLHVDAQEKLKHFQQQISQVTNQREYGAILREIDAVKTRIKEAEERALAAIEAAESAGRNLGTLRSSFDELTRNYETELKRWEAEKPGILSRAAELEAKASEVRQQIARGQLALFDRIFQKTNGTALARVRKIDTGRSSNPMWHCAACNYNVRPQLVVEIQAGAFHQCDSCKRILYWEAEPPEE